MGDKFVYLASGSPRRRKLLEQIGVAYVPLSLRVDETPEQGELPDSFVRRIALEKARSGLAALPHGQDAPVLGADTAVVVDGDTLGKPADRRHAEQMLMRLSDREHRVLTAVALIDREREQVEVSESRVWFRKLSPEECLAYCATGEPLDKAGAYAVQGLAASFIPRLDGSYSGVMGLPLFETMKLLAAFGIEPLRGDRMGETTGEQHR